MTISDLRRFAIARSLPSPGTLAQALDQLGFVQADPIRAPARAQDLILRLRVNDYRAGDLEGAYAALDAEEDYFINYGYVTRSLQAMMHPRSGMPPWPADRQKHSRAVLKFVRERGVVHPREVDAYFAHGKTQNYWGGTSNATTHLLDAMHFRGLLRVAGRSAGIRLYAVREPQSAPRGVRREARLDALVDALVFQYAPLPGGSLSNIIGRLRYCVPQWKVSLKAALRRAQNRLAKATVEHTVWYWPKGENLSCDEISDTVHFLAPFDPIVWDRRRFELFWGWPYRFEAYTPPEKRKLGYYALPLLWRDRVVGWGNVSVRGERLQVETGYVDSGCSKERPFKRALEAELARMKEFLSIR